MTFTISGVYCKKRDLPSFVELDGRKLSNNRMGCKKAELDKILAKYNGNHGDQDDKNDDHEDNYDDDDKPLKFLSSRKVRYLDCLLITVEFAWGKNFVCVCVLGGTIS